jgi:Ser/Thr protein kinase RdoA (MazF antagonist)
MFVKAIGPKPNPDSVAMHRREAHITRLLPVAAPVPRLLWSDDDPETGWVVLAFEEIEGRHPAQPWKLDELDRVLAMLATLAETLTPSPLPDGTVSSASEEFDRRLGGWRLLQAEPNPALDAWSRRHLDQLAQIEARSKDAVVGDSLLHFDVRADNLLLSTDKVWLVDWPLACTGAAWVDVVLFAPSVHMQGGPTPEELLARYAAVYPAFRDVDPDAVTAVIVALAGLFIHRSLRPPPPGLPTLRPFQAAQGAVTCAWLARWLGWD